MAKVKYRDAIKAAIIEELRKDPDLILIGEEIRQGYQGCFGVTKAYAKSLALTG
jgi:pyruvate/2-oxoglutarate/acetoin dehydrogenase E1 component